MAKLTIETYEYLMRILDSRMEQLTDKSIDYDGKEEDIDELETVIGELEGIGTY